MQTAAIYLGMESGSLRMAQARRTAIPMTCHRNGQMAVNVMEVSFSVCIHPSISDVLPL